MGVLTEQHFSATGTEKDKYSVNSEQQKQLQLSSVVVKNSYPANVEEMECLQELKRLINNSEDVRDSGIEQDDEFLLAFVRGKRCNSQKAFKTVNFQIFLNSPKSRMLPFHLCH